MKLCAIVVAKKIVAMWRQQILDIVFGARNSLRHVDRSHRGSHAMNLAVFWEAGNCLSDACDGPTVPEERHREFGRDATAHASSSPLFRADQRGAALLEGPPGTSFATGACAR